MNLKTCSETLSGILKMLFWTAFSFGVFTSSAAARDNTDATYVAYIEQVIPVGAKLSDVASVRRSGRDIPLPKNTVDLQPGDQIYIKKKDAAVIVRMLANNAIIPVQRGARKSSANEPDMTIPRPTLPGLTGAALSWLEGALGSADQSGNRTAMAGSRGIAHSSTCYNETGKTDDPTTFDIPALRAAKSEIVLGKRELFVSWRGGAPPYAITLSSADTGAVIDQVTGIRDGCTAHLQTTGLRQGRLRITLIDANNVREQDSDIYASDALPVMPAELRDADMPDDARELYFDTWLASLDGGKWAFEAQQRVAAMDCTFEGAREWLRQWGSLPNCGNAQ